MNEPTGKQNIRAFDFTPDKKTIAKGAIGGLLIQMLIRLKGIITLPLITYFMQPQEMGIYNIITITSMMFVPFVTLNLIDGPQVYYSQEKSLVKIRQMYFTVVNVVTFLVPLFTLIAYLILFTLRKDLYSYFFYIIPMLYANIFYNLVSMLLTVYQKIGILVKNTFVKDICISVFSVVSVYLGFSWKGMIFVNFFFTSLLAVFLFRFIIKELPYLFTINISYLKSFLRISLPLIPMYFFSWLIQYSDSYFLVYYFNEKIVGKYFVIYGLVNVILSSQSILHFFWKPLSARLWTDDREKYRKAFSKMYLAFSTVLLILVILFELNSKNLINLFVKNPEYHDAYIIMGIIAFAFTMQVLISLLIAPIYSNKNTNAIFVSYLSGGLIKVILGILFIPITGILGAAISTAVGYLTVVILMSYLNYRVANFVFLDKRLFYIVGVFVFIWIGVFYLREHLEIYQSIFVSISFLFVTSGILYLVSKQKEKDYLCSVYKEFNLKKVLVWVRR